MSLVTQFYGRLLIHSLSKGYFEQMLSGELTWGFSIAMSVCWSVAGIATNQLWYFGNLWDFRCLPQDAVETLNFEKSRVGLGDIYAKQYEAGLAIAKDVGSGGDVMGVDWAWAIGVAENRENMGKQVILCYTTKFYHITKTAMPAFL